MMLPDKKFTDFIDQNRLFERSGTLLAAVSGGMDSVLMVHLLKSSGYNFAIAHCNFQLRGAEADADQQFCKTLAQQNNAAFHTINFDTQQYAAENKISIQMAARELRYTWFEQLRQQNNYTVIALAHHQNDAIETILLNLVRGTGIAGLHGILPKNGWLVRPLLFLTRGEIEALIKQNGYSYTEDSSNASVKYARNKLRHEVIPKLQQLNPNLEHTFENNLRHFRDMEVLLGLRQAELKKELFIDSGDDVYLQLDAVKALNPQRLLLFKLLQDYGFNETAVDDLISVLNKHSGKVFEAANFKLILDRDKLIITPKNKPADEPVELSGTDNSINYGDYKLTVLHDDTPLIVKDNPMAVSVDADKLVYPLSIRTWQQSDAFYPLGMKTRKKLSDFFINLKIPLHEKNKIPLLINGNGHIIWIGGHRLDERYKVADNTKKVTIFELYKVK
ncbi:tRNA lysidine(34) synthetase TilS [Mucilaginibacter sp. UR6-11]|uniref:tRNA lysidine(34) synthetase TilS n=1 Tax=Mucilaginibacter sp. UR6-11 TaxID=1435644 RepID=UPI001E5310E5|nr:tRNA lysidine(34) synthetase TilS [Mucilaginibacter sp. UR6-11]MCC8424789.1 tRNA lysidine(34) synthetase TilS [Mucilaginibacter sp. UR6-11]